MTRRVDAGLTREVSPSKTSVKVTMNILYQALGYKIIHFYGHRREKKDIQLFIARQFLDISKNKID